MSYREEKAWTTASGLKAIAAVVNGTHRCGYVSVPPEHSLCGKPYGFRLLPAKWADVEARQTPFKGSPIDVLLAAYDRQEGDGPTLVAYFDVHGGITYAGKLNGGADWYFGFDCAHSGDARFGEESAHDVIRSLEYVEAECESLAKQLADFTGGTP